MYSVRR